MLSSTVAIVLCYILALPVGQDFTLLQTEVTFSQGATDGNVISVFVDVLDDLLVEGTEIFTLSGNVAAPASFVGDSVTVSILDNDGKWVWLNSSNLFLTVGVY